MSKRLSLGSRIPEFGFHSFGNQRTLEWNVASCVHRAGSLRITVRTKPVRASGSRPQFHRPYQDPLRAIREMVSAVRPGRYVFFEPRDF